MPFGTDAFLWYNVGDWAPLGFAVPNFGNDRTTQNGTILQLTQVIGRNLQAVMVHSDARQRTPPTINTITRIHKLVTRVRSILASRMVPAGVPNMEPAHVVPAAEEFIVYPAPYFCVRNMWLKEYASLCLMAITEMMQHQENVRPIEISESFAGQIGQYFQRIYRRVAVELLRVKDEDAQKLDFTISEEQLKAYQPTSWFTSTELIDTVPQESGIPTEDDLEVLTNGIPVSRLPVLGRWPAGAVGTASSGGTAVTPANEAFPPPPGV